MRKHSAIEGKNMNGKSKTILYFSIVTIVALVGAAGLKWHMIKMRHQFHFAAPHHTWATTQLLEMDVRLPDTPLITRLVNKLVPTVYACTSPPCNGQQSKAVPERNCGQINPSTGLPYCTEYTCASTTQNRLCTLDSSGSFWKNDPNCNGLCFDHATDHSCTPP